ncbi:putative metalloprotease CJM1_0395 family protein [Alteromonas sp. H39]|uniref:putative metalloprotease CJM1_0395 family protein n=1 Tax=Alteromonas sp. H39 TaxID=3389876 RepID=UPI0039E14F13
MNIVTPIPTSLVFPTANVNTESARRDNVLRETIPQASENEQGASQKGLGSESDRAKSPGQAPAPVTYERPQIQSNVAQSFSQAPGDTDVSKDNASDESAGKEDAEQRQKEQQEVQQLKTRDQEVRTHEKAHATIGGQYAGAPQYEFTTGPDGKRYATDGEVSIDISSAQTPEQTLQKMQQGRAAALAPAQPSPQDLEVAAEASQKAFDARKEIAEANRKEVAATSESFEAEATSQSVPSLDDIIDSNNVSIPTRTLDEAMLEAREGMGNNSDEPGNRSLNYPADEMSARIGVIQRFYSGVSDNSNAGFSVSA